MYLKFQNLHAQFTYIKLMSIGKPWNMKVFAWGFCTDQATKEQGLCEKTEGKYFPVQTEQTRLIRHLLYGFWFIFFSIYSIVFVLRCCRLPYLWVSGFRFMITLVRHSFASYGSIKKSIARAQHPGGQYTFFQTSRQLIRVCYDLKTNSAI